MVHRKDRVLGIFSSRLNWDTPPPHPHAIVSPPPLVPGGTHSLAGEGVGGSQFGRGDLYFAVEADAWKRECTVESHRKWCIDSGRFFDKTRNKKICWQNIEDPRGAIHAVDHLPVIFLQHEPCNVNLASDDSMFWRYNFKKGNSAKSPLAQGVMITFPEQMEKNAEDVFIQPPPVMRFVLRSFFLLPFYKLLLLSLVLQMISQWLMCRYDFFYFTVLQKWINGLWRKV